jgi:hypothetical protein
MDTPLISGYLGAFDAFNVILTIINAISKNLPSSGTKWLPIMTYIHPPGFVIVTYPSIFPCSSLNLTCHQIYNMNNTTDATRGAGYPFGAHLHVCLTKGKFSFWCCRGGFWYSIGSNIASVSENDIYTVSDILYITKN